MVAGPWGWAGGKERSLRLGQVRVNSEPHSLPALGVPLGQEPGFEVWFPEQVHMIYMWPVYSGMLGPETTCRSLTGQKPNTHAVCILFTMVPDFVTAPQYCHSPASMGEHPNLKPRNFNWSNPNFGTFSSIPHYSHP